MQRFFNAVSEGNTDETLLLLMSGIDVNTTFEVCTVHSDTCSGLNQSFHIWCH